MSAIEETIEPELGQVYADSRTEDLLQLIYLDSNVYVLQDEDGTHRFGTRREFDKSVDSKRYKFKPDEESFAQTGRIDRIREQAERYEAADGRTAAHKAEALNEALDILGGMGSERENEEVPFADLDGIGEKGARNLRNAGYWTVGDCRRAETEDLLDVSWIGEKGVRAIREYCD